MHLHPAIAALRSDPASQRRAQSALDAAHRKWRARDDVRAVADQFERYSKGECLQELSALHALLHDLQTACEFVHGTIEDMLAALRDEPLGEVPFGHSSREDLTCLRLFTRRGAALSLFTHSDTPDAAQPESAQFADCELHALVLSGAARCDMHSLCEGGAAVATQEVALSAGSHIVCRARDETRQIREVEQTMLVLQLTRTPDHPRPTREIRLSDGAVVRQASGDRRASEQVMALAVLGALADPRNMQEMRRFALDRSRDQEARWEAVRQVLALETEAGLHLLGKLVSQTEDVLCRPAIQLRDQLLATYPTLRSLSKEIA